MLGSDVPERCEPLSAYWRRGTDHGRNSTVGWISTVRVLGDIFNLQGFFVWHLIMAVAMCAVWLILFSLTILAFWKGKIFLAKDEDVWKDTIVPPEENTESDVEKGPRF